MNWFYVDLHGNRLGPVPHEQFCMMFADGTLGLATLVWTESFKDWIEAAHINGFRELARHAPPPRPPPLPPLANLAPGQGPVAPAAPPPMPVPAIPVAQPVDPATIPAPPQEDAWPEPVHFNSHAVAPSISKRPAMGAEFDDLPTDGHYDEEGNRTADPAQAQPVTRFCARCLDATIAAFFGSLVLAALRVENVLVSYYAPLLAWVFVEPLLLSTWGYTPGKAILGVEVRDLNGNKLSFAAALNRTIVVYIKGMGLGIPVLNVVMKVMAFNHLRSFGSTVWDEEGGFTVRHALVSPGRALAAVVIFLAALGLGVMVSEATAGAGSHGGVLDPEAAAAYGQYPMDDADDGAEDE